MIFPGDMNVLPRICAATVPFRLSLVGTSGLTCLRLLVLRVSMTNELQVVSVKFPARLLRRIPKAGHGRSGFILQAVEEKISRQSVVEWQPTTARGRRMATIIAQGKSEGVTMESEEWLENELRARRGRFA